MKQLILIMLVLMMKYISAQTPEIIKMIPDYHSSIHGGPKQRTIADILGNSAVLEPSRGLHFGLISAMPFGIKEISYVIGIAQWSGNSSSLALMQYYTGNSMMKDVVSTFAYSKSWDKKVALSVGVTYRNQVLLESFKKSYFLGSISCKLKYTDKIYFGLQLADLGYLNMNNDNALPISIKTGIAFMPSDPLEVTLDLISPVEQNPYVYLTFRYDLTKKMSCRLGIHSENKSAAYEVSIPIKKLTLRVGLTYHPILGISPYTMLSDNLF